MFKVGNLLLDVTVTTPPYVSSVLFLQFVSIRKVGTKWKFRFLVQFHQTPDACKAIHDVKTPQVSK